jgi:hypothetical protein
MMRSPGGLRFHGEVSMIEFTCDCGNSLSTDETNRGKAIICPACGKQRPVPDDAEARVTAEPPTRPMGYTEEERPGRTRRLDDEPEHRRRAAEPPKSRALFYTMIGLGVAAAVGCVFCVPVLLLFPAVQKIREAAARMQSTNNLHQLGLAMHNYESAYDHFPLAYTVLNSQPGGAPQPGMSWRAQLLPYLEQQPIYMQIQPQQPWDSPGNQLVQSTVVKTYQQPGDPKTSTQTYYQVFVTVRGKKPHSAFNDPTDEHPKVKLTDITDGASKTILIAESPTSVPWLKPQDMTFDPDQPPPPLGYHFVAGSLILMGDGAVKTVPKNENPATIKALITRDGNEQIVDPNW